MYQCGILLIGTRLFQCLLFSWEHKWLLAHNTLRDCFLLVAPGHPNQLAFLFIDDRHQQSEFIVSLL